MSNYLWLVVVPNINTLFSMFGILGFITSLVLAIITFDRHIDAYTEECYKDVKKWFVLTLKTFAASLVLLFISCFLPTRTQVIQLKVMNVVSDLKGADQLPQKVVDKLSKLLELDEEK